MTFGLAACSGSSQPDSVAGGSIDPAPPVESAQLPDQATGTAAEAAALAEATVDTPAPLAEAENLDASALDTEPQFQSQAQLALANASPDQCPAGARFVPGGPPGFDGGFASGGGTSGQSLFDAAGAGGFAGNRDRIDVPPSSRAGRLIRFGNPNAPSPIRERPAQRNLRLTPTRLAGTWLLTDGSPTCACTVTLNSGSGGETNTASAACATGNLNQVAAWRLRGEEIVLLGTDRTLIGSLFTTDGQVFSGGLTAGGLATLWRE
ncbi:MAG: AprI/Inh family metalloprotease inhibitor [Pseudomonadota bacterium]